MDTLRTSYKAHFGNDGKIPERPRSQREKYTSNVRRCVAFVIYAWAFVACVLICFKAFGLAVCLGESTEPGIYRIERTLQKPKIGEKRVISGAWDTLGVQRGLHNKKRGMIKEVAGLPGMEIAVDSFGTVTVAGKPVAGCKIAKADKAGRALPVTRDFPYTLGKDEYFVVSHKEKGWDSRYFGPVPLKELERRARPVITRSVLSINGN